MKVLDICSGIGGFSLAAAWCGWQTVGFVEIDPYCRRVLAKHWPEVPQHDDIWTLTAEHVRGWLTDAAALADANQPKRQAWSGDGLGACESSGSSACPRLDLLCGGIPCQPFSVAGKQRGQHDPRHLWPAVARLVADLRPRWLCIENVSGFIKLALDDLLADLDRLGYAAWPLVVPAAGVGALHRRDRVWIVAHAADVRCDRHQSLTGGAGASEAGWRMRQPARSGERETEPRLCTQADGLSGWLARPGFMSDHWQGDPMNAFGHDHEYGVPLVVSGRVPERVNKLKALGNAIVPQVAYQIFRAMQEAEA